MNFLVTNECGVVPKEFPTFIALKRPFSSVGFLVLNKMEFSNEGHPTSATLIRPYSSVDFLVLNKNLFLAKGFPTLSTHIIILSSSKGLPALGVPSWLKLTVSAQALEKACAGWEVLLTFTAYESMLCHVNTAVHHK